MHNLPEVSALEYGMDFRRPEYRREVFHRVYAFTLKYRIHPGCVYFALPALRDELALDEEGSYWLSFLNGNTQNPITSWLIMKEFPTIESACPDKVDAWLQAHWAALEFDTDRRWWKAKLAHAVSAYSSAVSGLSQLEYFSALADARDEKQGFEHCWKTVRSEFLGFGRLSAWSYLEYLRIGGLLIQPRDLMLRDMSGSQSHRNGLCKVLGRDDLDWHKSNPAFDGKYDHDVLVWLEQEAEMLLAEARVRAAGLSWESDVNHLTMESCFCQFKSYFRPNRRYPAVYADMMHDRIKRAEACWPMVDFGIFWEMRERALPKQLRLECNPMDVGASPLKQNMFRITGKLPMLDVDDPAFLSEYSERIQ